MEQAKSWLQVTMLKKLIWEVRVSKVKSSSVKKMILAALFLALGIIFPFFTAQIKEIGDTLLPMHMPVMLCGLVCGWQYGLTVGVLVPMLRAFSFGMPPLYPNAVWMALELATYGFVLGCLYEKRRKSIGWLYACLAIGMIAGRIVWGIAKAILLGMEGSSFTMAAFIAGGFVDALPGIVLQFVVIPIVMRIKKN